MSKFSKVIFIILLVIFSYHLIRDVFQIIEVNNSIVDFLHRDHQWCKPYCDYVTIPPEIFIIISSMIVFKRNEVGKLGLIAFLSLIFWPFFIWLP
jgi:hypothetical protein